MNNPRIDELLKGCNNCVFDDESREEYFCSYFNGLCPTCKAELLGILGQMKCEVEDLKKLFGRLKNCGNLKLMEVYEDDEVKLKKTEKYLIVIEDYFCEMIEELNSDIKRIEDDLK